MQLHKIYFGIFVDVSKLKSWWRLFKEVQVENQWN